MRKGTAANLSLTMALLMWPLGAMGFLSMLADHRLGMSSREVGINEGIWVGLPLTVACAFLIASAWLSGYSYSEAKRRASTVCVLCSGFVIVVFWNLVLVPVTRH